MDTEWWQSQVEKHKANWVKEHADACKAGVDDPVLVLIDPREGSARRFAIDKSKFSESDIDVLISTAERMGDRPLMQLFFEREKLKQVLPPAVELGPVERSFWIVFLEANEVNAVRMSRFDPGDN
jgi:predicted nucleotidyltransferase